MSVLYVAVQCDTVHTAHSPVHCGTELHQVKQFVQKRLLFILYYYY